MTDFEPGVDRVPDAEIVKTRSSAILRVLGSLIGWSLLTAVIALGTAFWGYSSYTASGPLTDDKVITITDQQPREEMAKFLLDEGVIADPKIFNIAMAYLNRNGKAVKSGEYEFKAGSSMAEIIAMLRQGRVLTYKLTIPEGWTSQMALNRIADNQVLTGDIPALPPEGSLMADTFVFQRGMTRAELVADMQSAQTKLVDTLWSSRPADSPIKTKEELLTLASIVEKETGQAEERPQVAAVFLNRLRKGMRLQSDPTIIYGIVGSKGKLDRPLKRSDIDETTAYNTYRIPGLPPGPIASPGRAALEAVLNPAKVDYIYFVADGTGGHAFATTLEEHNDNVKQWRKIENGEEPAPAEVDPAVAPPVAPAATPAAETGLPMPTPEPAAVAAPEATVAPAVADEAPEVAAEAPALTPAVVIAPEVKKPEIKSTATGLENLQLENDGSSEAKKPEEVQKPVVVKTKAAAKPAVKPVAKKVEAKKSVVQVKPEAKSPAKAVVKAVAKPEVKKPAIVKAAIKKPAAEIPAKAIKKKLPVKPEAPKTN